MVDVAGLTCDTRSSAVELFDHFMAISFSENSDIFSNASYLSLASTVAVLLSSKIHEVRPIPMARFAHFSSEDIVQFELLFLVKLDFQADPQNTSINFVRHILHIWMKSNPNFSVTNSNHLYMLAGDVIAEFLESHDSLCFAPSTIGMTALLASFSKFKLNCQELFNTCQTFNLMHQKLMPNQEFLHDHTKLPVLDIQACFQLMQVLPSMQYIAPDASTNPNDAEVSDCHGAYACTSDDCSGRDASSPVGVADVAARDPCIPS